MFEAEANIGYFITKMRCFPSRMHIFKKILQSKEAKRPVRLYF
jgi:hypothetical protein